MTTDTEPNVFLAAGFTPSDLTPAWIDAAGQTYAYWLASVAEAQQRAANLCTAYTPGPVPVFTVPGG